MAQPFPRAWDILKHERLPLTGQPMMPPIGEYSREMPRLYTEGTSPEFYEPNLESRIASLQMEIAQLQEQLQRLIQMRG